MITRFLIRFFPSIIISRLSSSNYRRFHFVVEYKEALKRIYKGEFVGAVLKESREVLRREYDKLNEMLDATKVMLEKTTDTQAREEIKKNIEAKEADIKEWKSKIDLMDETIRENSDNIASTR